MSRVFFDQTLKKEAYNTRDGVHKILLVSYTQNIHLAEQYMLLFKCSGVFLLIKLLSGTLEIPYGHQCTKLVHVRDYFVFISSL